MTGSKSNVGGVTIVAREGVRDAVQDVVGRGEQTIVIDLRELQSIDSSGIGELMAAYTIVRVNRGQLKLVNPAWKVRTLLQISRLSTLLGLQPGSIVVVEQRVSGVDDSHVTPEAAEVFAHHVKQRGRVSKHGAHSGAPSADTANHICANARNHGVWHRSPAVEGVDGSTYITD